MKNREVHPALPEAADSLEQVLDSVSCDVTRLDAYRPAPVEGIKAEDLKRLFEYQVEFLGRSAIFAISHMRAIASVMRDASSVYSPFVLCRAVLEPLGHLYWACDERLGPNGRLLGILRSRMSEQPKALAVLQDHGSDEKIREAESIIESDGRALDALKAGMSKAQIGRTKQPNATDAVSKLMDGHKTKHTTAYSLLSEHSHGNTTWVGAREFTDLESLKQMRPTQASVETFLLPALWPLEGMSRAFERAHKIMPLEFDRNLLAGQIDHLVHLAQSCGHDDVWQLD